MSYSAEVLADSPMLYWRLGEASGLTAEDATANNLDGTYHGSGVTYSQVGALSGDSNTAVLFDGNAGEVHSAASVNPASNIVTFECLAKFPSFNNSFDLLAEFSTNWSTNNGSFVSDPCDSSGSWQIGIRSAGANSSRTFPRPSAGAYHHCVFVYDMSTATTRFVVYVDNVVQTLSGSGNITSANFGNYVLHVGSRAGTSLFLNATIDEVAFYANELGSSRVAVHYDAISVSAGFVPQVMTF